MNRNVEAECNSANLNLNSVVDNVVQIFKSHVEEVQELGQKKWNLEVEIERLKTVKQQLEQEKSEIDAEITRLKVRNAAYQKEHTNLRNSITVVRFQIEKIKEGIAQAKANDLKALEDFEKSVDEITEKFRSSPINYDRKVLSEKIENEKAKRETLLKKLEELNNSYEEFNKANGLRMRKDENEELANCILPDSTLSCYIEMTKTLDEVICGIRNLTGGRQQPERNSEPLVADK